MVILQFFKNIVDQILNKKNMAVSESIDDVFFAKDQSCSKCFAYNCKCTIPYIKLPSGDDSTKKYLYVVNNQLFFGTKADIDTLAAGGANGGTRLD